MRITAILSFLLLLQFGFTGTLNAQQARAFDPLKDDISNLLPPLAALMDSAIANNPYIQFRDLQVIVNRCKLKSNQIEWMRNIGFSADVRYGNFYNYSQNSVDGVEPPAVATNRAETKWGGAVYIKFPVYELVNRKNLLKMAGLEVDQAQKMAEVQRDEVRQLVIRQYNELILKQKVLKVKTKFSETSKISMQLVEKEFLNGIIPLTEYSRLSEAASRTEVDYEVSRMDFLTAYLVLQEIVGIDFQLTNQISGKDEGN
jgi:outer membrane protein TolC